MCDNNVLCSTAGLAAANECIPGCSGDSVRWRVYQLRRCAPLSSSAPPPDPTAGPVCPE